MLAVTGDRATDCWKAPKRLGPKSVPKAWYVVFVSKGRMCLPASREFRGLALCGVGVGACDIAILSGSVGDGRWIF